MIRENDLLRGSRKTHFVYARAAGYANTYRICSSFNLASIVCSVAFAYAHRAPEVQLVGKANWGPKFVFITSLPQSNLINLQDQINFHCEFPSPDTQSFFHSPQDYFQGSNMKPNGILPHAHGVSWDGLHVVMPAQPLCNAAYLRTESQKYWIASYLLACVLVETLYDV